MKRKEKIKEIWQEQTINDGSVFAFVYEHGIDKFIDAILAIPLDVPSDKEIEQYLLKKYPPLFVDDNGNPFDVNKSFRESTLIDIKAAMSGEIKKKEG